MEPGERTPAGIDTGQEYDRERDKILTDIGLVVLRFRNDEVINHLTDVLQRIAKAACR
ncbi:MAG: DUF559 domain-containing protein [Anaerolineaceae bacterium]|nr:DUF559 domain-containing protein [Anaerolineaceae bacterium]